MKHLATAFRNDVSGNVAILTAILAVVMAGIGAFGVDLGRIYVDRRKAQSVADLASISAASDLANARLAAVATANRNAMRPGAVKDVILGTYIADPAVKPDNRFRPAPQSAANAAHVTIETTAPLFFGRLLTGSDRFTVRTGATAIQTAQAAFAIGSGLVSINDGLLNQILGGLLGTNISLSLMDYRSLLDANLQLFGFLDSLASRVRLTGGSYDKLLDTEVEIADVTKAMIDTAKMQGQSDYQTIVALERLAADTGTVSRPITLRPLIDPGVYGRLVVGESPQVDMAVSALDLLSAAAQVANGSRQIEVDLGLRVPGIAKASLQLAIGERPQGTSWLSVGSVGASVHTAQTRLLLTVQIGGSRLLPEITLPIYLELASGTATLDAVACGYPDIATSTVRIGVRTGVLDSWIGDVSRSDFTNFTSHPEPGPAVLVKTPLASVTGRAHATIQNRSPVSLKFTHDDIRTGTKKTASTSDYVGSLLPSLIGDLDLRVATAGLNVSLPGPLLHAVKETVASAARPLDQVLSTTLQALGISLGQSTVWAMGIRCDGAVLVN